MKSLCALALLAVISIPLHGQMKKPAQMDRALATIQNAKAAEDALSGLVYILAHASEAPALHLFAGSMAALGNSRLEDAAFLFYAGQMRARFDLVRYPPKASGSDSPAVLLGALNQQIGAAVNPAIMREPASLAKVLKRIEAWTPSTPAGYAPWEHATVADEAGKQQWASLRSSFLTQFGGLVTLLSDPEYFAAFKTIQDYNFSPPDKAQEAKRRKAMEAAEKTMLAIETKRGIEGMYYRKSPPGRP